MNIHGEPWKTLERSERYRGPWRHFVVERVRTHSGAEIEYSYVQTPEAVLVVPLTADGRLVLVRQYRHPVRAWVWEVPAGAVGDEAPEEAARRELAEEIGGRCTALEAVGWHYGLPSAVASRHHVYFASGVTLGKPRQEPTELLQVVPVAAEQALAWARDGTIQSADSAVALLRCEARIRRVLGR